MSPFGGIQIVGEAGVRDLLSRYSDLPKLNKRLQAATKAGGTVLKGPARAQAASVSSRLARSTSLRTARSKPGSILSFRPKVAFFRAWILSGTKDHGPRKAAALVFMDPRTHQIIVTHSVHGVKADPILDRVAAEYESQVYAAFEASLTETESGGIPTDT